MKKVLCLFAVIFVLISAKVFYFSPKNIAIAENDSKNEVSDSVEDTVDGLLDKLDTVAFEEYYSKFSDEQKNLAGFQTVKAFVKYLTEYGVSSDAFRSFFDYVAKSALGGVTSMLPSFASVLIISVLSAILGGLTSSLKKETSEVVCITLYIAAVLTVMNALVPIVLSTEKTISDVKTLSTAVFPLLLTLTTALGGTVSAGIFQPLTVVFASGIVELISRIVLPAFVASVIFSAIGNVSDSVKLDKTASLFKNVSSWVLGLTFGLFVTFATVQGVSGATVDNATLAATRKLVAGNVPVLGEYLSDGLDIALVGCGLVKNGLGIAAMVVVLIATLAPVMKLAAFLLLTKFTAAVGEAVGDKKISAMLTGIGKSTGLLVSALAGVTFVFMVLCMLMIYCFNPGV